MKSQLTRLNLLIALLALACPAALADNVLIPVASPGIVTVGSFFDVFVEIDQVTNLSGFQFDLIYNPGRVSLSAINGGTIFDPNPALFIPGIDDLMGTIAFNAGVLFGPGGVNAMNGQLMVFQFLALMPGEAFFNVSNILLTDDLGNPILPDVPMEGIVIINAIPEPSTILLSAGVFLMVLSRKRRMAA